MTDALLGFLTGLPLGVALGWHAGYSIGRARGGVVRERQNQEVRAGRDGRRVASDLDRDSMAEFTSSPVGAPPAETGRGAV